jgi:hypothetical protein
MKAGGIRVKWQQGAKTNRMTPEYHTLFSLTLFIALSTLLAWSNRRNRARLEGEPITVPVTVSVPRGDRSNR